VVADGAARGGAEQGVVTGDVTRDATHGRARRATRKSGSGCRQTDGQSENQCRFHLKVPVSEYRQRSKSAPDCFDNAV